jgi:hypothetical protein
LSHTIGWAAAFVLMKYLFLTNTKGLQKIICFSFGILPSFLNKGTEGEILATTTSPPSVCCHHQRNKVQEERSCPGIDLLIQLLYGKDYNLNDCNKLLTLTFQST